MKAKEEPRNTGLLERVKSRYTMVPMPAPNRAAAGSMSTPMAPLIMAGTARVAAIMASSCWNANTIRWENLGLSLMP